MTKTQHGWFGFHGWPNCTHIATSLAWVVAAGLILAGLVWLSDAYATSRFLVVPWADW